MIAKRAFPVLVVLFGASLSLRVSAIESRELSTQCVGSEAKKNLATCPGGPEKFERKARPTPAFKAPPPPRDIKKREEFKPRSLEAVEKLAERDTRKIRLIARARALLITEIEGLGNLFRRTGRRSPDRPQLIRRMAEDYVELETAAVRDKLAAEVNVSDLTHRKKATTPALCNMVGQCRNEAAKAAKIAALARQQAIKYYTLMKDQYPNYSKLDEVLYYLAYEHEQVPDAKMARKVYFELIEKSPKSPYIPNAYLAFGELFFQEAQGDPQKWVLAQEAYSNVLKYPAPENKQWGYAAYKLGYVFWNTGDYGGALTQFKKVIEWGDKYSTQHNAPQLAKSARRDVIPVYAASGDPGKAYNFFKPLSGDQGGEQTKTVDMMNELGLAYLDSGHYKEGIVLYKDLMGRDPGPKTCFYQSQITSAIQAIYSGDKDRVVEELDKQLLVRADFLKKGNPDKDKLACSNRTAEFLAETAMSWHLEAVGSGGVRGTGDKKTMDLASLLYKKVGQNFTKEDFAKFEFPRIVKEDWPNMYKIKYAMADLLYFQQKWQECGPAFDAVVQENPTGPNAAEAAYAAVLCYQKMYELMYKGDAARKGKGLGPKGAGEEDRKSKGGWEKFKPMNFTDMQKGMINAFNRYVCYIKPTKGDKEAEEQYVEVKYARARTYYEAQHWEEAAIAFRDVAINHADKDAGIYAAQLYLEAVNVLGSRAEPPRPACFDDMAADVPTFLELYCKGEKFTENKEQCELLTRIKFDVQRLGAQKTIELADSQADKGNYREALDNYKKGADAYNTLWKTYCEEPLSKGEKPKQCERADEIVYNMARGYQASRLLAQSIKARLILLDKKYGLQNSELAKRSTYEIGGNYQAFAVYSRAADYFEQYAKDTNYRGEFADKAVSDAAVLRLGLGQEDKAIDDAKNYNRYYGAKKPKMTAQIAFAIAAHYGEKKDWGEVLKHLGGQGMGLIDRNATLDIRAQAHALAARAHAKSNHDAQSGNEYHAVAKLWAEPAKAVKEIDSIEGEDTSSKQRRLGRALEAVGEALFYFAEKSKAKVDKVKFPEYQGKFVAKKPAKNASSEAWQKYMDEMKKEKDAIQKHIQTKVLGWVKEKKPLIDQASAEYKKIVNLEPLPPPRWVIAAGSRVGDMWGQFVKEFRAAPIPTYMKEDAELRGVYYESLDSASEPQKQSAKGAYETCLGYSVKYQYFDEFSRNCEVWLATNYKKQYHLIDEFRGAPDRLNSALREQGRPLRIGGEPMIAEAEKREFTPVSKPPAKKEEEGAKKEESKEPKKEKKEKKK
jgi:hypothetical protein